MGENGKYLYRFCDTSVLLENGMDACVVTFSEKEGDFVRVSCDDYGVVNVQPGSYCTFPYKDVHEAAIDCINHQDKYGMACFAFAYITLLVQPFNCDDLEFWRSVETAVFLVCGTQKYVFRSLGGDKEYYKYNACISRASDEAVFKEDLIVNNAGIGIYADFGCGFAFRSGDKYWCSHDWHSAEVEPQKDKYDIRMNAKYVKYMYILRIFTAIRGLMLYKMHGKEDCPPVYEIINVFKEVMYGAREITPNMMMTVIECHKSTVRVDGTQVYCKLWRPEEYY